MFRSFKLFEASKTPVYKVGDRLKTGPYYKEYDMGSSFEKGKNTTGGAIVEVTEVSQKSGKAYYTTKVVYGSYAAEQKRSRRFNSYSDYSLRGEGRILKGFAKDFTAEGVEEFEKLVKTAKYKIGDAVSVRAGANQLKIDSSSTWKPSAYTKITSRTVKAFAIDQSLEEGVMCYILSGSEYAVKETDISKEEDLSEAQIEELADAIADKIGIKVSKTSGGNFKFETEIITELLGSKSVIIFKDLKSKQEFNLEFQKLVRKYSQTNLNKIFQKSLTFTDNSKETSEYSHIEISSSKILEAAKNLEIDVEEYLKSREGKIAGKSYGI